MSFRQVFSEIRNACCLVTAFHKENVKKLASACFLKNRIICPAETVLYSQEIIATFCNVNKEKETFSYPCEISSIDPRANVAFLSLSDSSISDSEETFILDYNKHQLKIGKSRNYHPGDKVYLLSNNGSNVEVRKKFLIATRFSEDHIPGEFFKIENYSDDNYLLGSPVTDKYGYFLGILMKKGLIMTEYFLRVYWLEKHKCFLGCQLSLMKPSKKFQKIQGYLVSNALETSVLKNNDILLSINNVNLGNAKKQVAPSLILWRTERNQELVLKINREDKEILIHHEHCDYPDIYDHWDILLQ